MDRLDILHLMLGILMVFAVAMSIMCISLLKQLDTYDKNLVSPKCSDYNYSSYSHTVFDIKSKILKIKCI